MKVLGLCGSLQERSANRALLGALERLCAAKDIDYRSFDGIRELPLFNPDLERIQSVDAVEAWRAAIRESDALFIATPEYGHSLPGALKNAVDWVIGTGELEKKLIAITSVVPSDDRGWLGLRALRDTLGAVSARIVGGVPIVRGPQMQEDAERMLSDLIEVYLATQR